MSSTPPESTVYESDACGNLTFDGAFYYQYDAWNRLIQVNPAARSVGTITPLPPCPSEIPPLPIPGAASLVSSRSCLPRRLVLRGTPL